MTLSSTRALANGVEIPVLGLGVYLSEPGRETQDAVAWALDLGYRHVDTAAVYHNEKDVGEAVRHSGVRREDVFVTTKLGNRDHGYDAALRAFEKSLKRLRLDYVDLYIIHWPVAQGRRESWRALERIYREGRAKAVGVSNYTVRHLEETLAHAEVAPMVDQVEFSPFLHQRDLLRYCEEHDIVVEAYSPLTRGRRLSHPTITTVAQAHGKSPAQVLIRWTLQRGLVTLPKSVRRERIAENGAVFDFELSDDEMSALDGLNEDLHVAWDPTGAP